VSRFRPKRSWQDLRRAGTEQRWARIRSQIAGARSLLDIGCNAGVLTARAAEAGLVSIGVETRWEFVQVARRRWAGSRPVTFLHFTVDRDSVEALPECDVVLCLSVYHQWHRRYGHDAAQDILRALGRKARRVLFFEPASKLRKYGDAAPDFRDRDEPSIVAYNHAMLSGLFGEGPAVEFLGGTPSIRGEAFRYLFAVRTAGVRSRPR
jgi:SAM-dependent methyltransferase